MKKIIKLTAMALSFSACDFLDMVPEKDIETIESVFETRQNAEIWRDGTYGMIHEFFPDFTQNVAYFGADEFIACQALQNYSMGGGGKYDLPGFQIAAGRQMSQNPYGDYWSRDNEYNTRPTLYEVIRSCNTFLENIDRVYNMTDREKEEWAAEIKGLKAFCYFELVRRYGPIVLIPKNIDMEHDVTAMQLPRSHVDTCFKAIVQLCDEAAEVLPTQQEKSIDRRAYFSKEAVLMLKAKALLYAASPMFNGNPFYSDFVGKNGEPLFSMTVDQEKWRLAAEACDEAVAVAESAGHKLVATTSATSGIRDYMDDIEHSVLSDFDNDEMILEWKVILTYQLFMYNMLLPRVNTALEPGSSPHFNTANYGALSPSMKMVEMYYTENGLPIDMDNTWNYSGRYTMSQEASGDYNMVVPLNQDVLQLHLRREPRFYACIAADRTYWQRGPLDSYDDNNLLVTAYKGEYFGSQFDIITSTGYQNINGYWCKKHLDSEQHTYSYAQSQDHTMPLMRLAELYLMQAEAWNEYEGPSQKVYDAINKVRDRAGIPDVVTAWKSYSRDPGKVDTKEGMREIIHRETDIEMAFEGCRFFNLRRWLTANETLNERQMGWNILGETASQFYNNWNGPIVVWSQVGFTSPRDYLFPINAEEVLRSSIVQNPGW